MTQVSKLKDEARRHEQQEDWDRAIQLYLRVLRGAEDGQNEIELPLYNRVGDLYLRLGRPDDAVTYYEQAADRYAEAGLHNNAIALCNKALRYAPDRLALVRKLGRFCALQGFVTDARRWYLTYAERMFAQGSAEEALGALEDFANISDEADVRELLARHLHAHGKVEQALTEYRRALGIRLMGGDTAGAEVLRAEVLELYPDEVELTPVPLKPRQESETPSEEHEADRLPRLAEAEAATVPIAPPAGPPAAAPPLPEPEAVPEPADALTAEGDFVRQEHARPDVDALPGLESTGLGDDTVMPRSSQALAGFESTALSAGEATPSAAGGFDTMPGLDSSGPALTDLPTIDDVPEDLTPLPLLDAPGADERHAADSLFNVGAIELRPETAPADALRDSAPPEDYVDLYSFINPDEDRLTGTRFVIEEKEPTGDEDRDFAELLAQFKAKLHEAVDPEDAASHYDLGLAFKEMGLVDEAIAEFQRAMRAGDERVKILEELGQCFSMKGQFNIAARVLQTAVGMHRGDELELIGVFYHLGRAYEAVGKNDEARDAYERVMGLDINFQDVNERIVRL
jgi:tetratricopeptide (TPR) repeat protein